MNKPPSMLDMLFVLGERATDDVGEIFRQIIEHDDAPKINHEICYDLVEIKAVLFSYVARNFWFWYLICIILWRVLYGK